MNHVSLTTQSKNKRKLKLLKGAETQVFQHLFLVSNFLYYSIIYGSFGYLQGHDGVCKRQVGRVGLCIAPDGAAAILPVLPDGRIIMVRQYRNALERETIEIPAGARDSKTEDTKVCATRELEEETGYRSHKVEFLLSLRTTVAFCDEHVDVYLATDLEKIGEQHFRTEK